METILATAFGRKVDVQGGEADELTNAVKSFFSHAEEGQLASREVLIMLNSESFLISTPPSPSSVLCIHTYR